MSLFKNLDQDVAIEENRLGGFTLFPTDIYEAEIKMAYADAFPSGANFVQLQFEMPDGREYSERLIITNSSGENTYNDKRTGVKKGLPGFTILNDIHLFVTGEPLNAAKTEKKQVLVYDYDLGKEVPQSKEVLIELIGQKIAMSIQQIKKNKQEKNESTGKYEDVNEAREVNEIHTIFHPETKFTTTELRNGVEEPVFWDKWLEKNKDKVIDRFKEVNSKPAAFGMGGGNKAASGNPFAK